MVLIPAHFLKDSDARLFKPNEITVDQFILINNLAMLFIKQNKSAGH